MAPNDESFLLFFPSLGCSPRSGHPSLPQPLLFPGAAGSESACWRTLPLIHRPRAVRHCRAPAGDLRPSRHRREPRPNGVLQRPRAAGDAVPSGRPVASMVRGGALRRRPTFLPRPGVVPPRAPHQSAPPPGALRGSRRRVPRHVPGARRRRPRRPRRRRRPGVQPHLPRARWHAPHVLPLRCARPPLPEVHQVCVVPSFSVLRGSVNSVLALV